jgi:putative membrane protein
LLIVLLVRWIAVTDGGGRGNTPARPTPLEILQERFAKGEIDKQEHEERRKLLGN